MFISNNICLSPLKNFNNKFSKENSQSIKNDNNSKPATNLSVYPNYYPYISSNFKRRFKPFTVNNVVRKIGFENFPMAMAEKAQELIKANKGYQLLYNVHKEVYAPLLKCKTLDEAKEMFPEFADVKELSEIHPESFRKKTFLRNIYDGNIEGLTVDNFSLKMLQKVYAEAKTKRDLIQEYNNDNIYKILSDKLGIKFPSKKYADLLYRNSSKKYEQSRDIMSQKAKLRHAAGGFPVVPYSKRILSDKAKELRRKALSTAHEACPELSAALQEEIGNHPGAIRALYAIKAGKKANEYDLKSLNIARKTVWDKHPNLHEKFGKALANAYQEIYLTEN